MGVKHRTFVVVAEKALWEALRAGPENTKQWAFHTTDLARTTSCLKGGENVRVEIGRAHAIGFTKACPRCKPVEGAQ